MLRTILIFCLLAFSSAQAVLTGIPRDAKVLFVGDSQTQCVVTFPNPSDAYGGAGEPIWDGSAIPWIWPDKYGSRETSYDDWNPYSGRIDTDADSANWQDMLGRVKYYSHGSIWGHRVADLLGTPYWVTLSQGGALLKTQTGTHHERSGMDAYFEDNPWYATADVFVLYGGINDCKAGAPLVNRSAAELVDTYEEICGKALREGKIVLALCPQPLGGYSPWDPAADADKEAKVDSLRDGIVALETTFSDYVSRGRFASFDYGRYLITDPAGTDNEDIYGETLAARFNDDNIHKSRRGDLYFGNLIAWKVFGCELDTTSAIDTLDAGDWLTPLYTRTPQTIYVDPERGDNFKNWMDPFSLSRPLAHPQAALFRASPGDRIELAATEYANLWPSENEAGTASYEVMFPWYDGTATAPIVMDGNGATFTNPAHTVLMKVVANHTTRQESQTDSVARIHTTFTDMTFDGYSATNGTEAPFNLQNMGDITLDNLTFTDCAGALKISYNTVYPDSAVLFDNPLTYTVTDCEFTNTDGYPPLRTGNTLPVDYDVELLVKGCTLIDTTGSDHDGFAYLNKTSEAGHPSKLELVGNTVVIDSMQSSVAVIYTVGWNKQIWAGNLFDVNEVDYSNIRSIGYIAQNAADSLLVFDNIFEVTDNDAETYLIYVSAGTKLASNNLVAESYSGDGAEEIFNGAYETKSFLWERQALHGGVSDTLYFGGLNTYLGHELSEYNITAGTNHASIGPMQYDEDPLVWTGRTQGRDEYAIIEGPWALLNLINSGVLPVSDSLDVTTWYQLPRVYNESDYVQIRSWLDAYNAWPEATRIKIRWRISGTPVTISSADSTYNGPWALLAAIDNSDETASDSLDASTWFALDRVHSLSQQVQYETFLDAYNEWPEATRIKIRYVAK